MNRIIRYLHYYLLGSFFVLIKKPVRVHGNLILYPEGTDKILIGSSLFGKYEIFEKRLIEKFLEPNSKVLELGGNIGGISNYINKKLSVKENHIVMEPNPKIIPLLKKNRNLNNSKFKIVNGIISKDKNVIFYLSKNTLSSSTKVISNNKLSPKSYSITEIEDM